MQKQTAIFNGPGKDFTLKKYTLPDKIPEGFTGLKLIYSGICGTDVHIHQGCIPMPDFPMTIGHEFIGEVDQLPDYPIFDADHNELKKGDKVIITVATPCGKCHNCLEDEKASCMNFGVAYAKDVNDSPHFHGGFSEYLYIHAKNTIKLPSSLNPLAAAAFPCGGPTIIRSCKYGGGISKGDLVLIQGNGSLGLFALALAKSKGAFAAITGSTQNAKRLEITKRLNPDLFIDFREHDTDSIKAIIAEKTQNFQGKGGVDVVIETSGAPTAFTTGLDLLRIRGKYFVPGQYSDRGTTPIPPHLITFKALQIFGSGQYTFEDIKDYVNFISMHNELQDIFAEIPDTYSLELVNQAIADAADGKTIKAVFAEQ